MKVYGSTPQMTVLELDEAPMRRTGILVKFDCFLNGRRRLHLLLGIRLGIRILTLVHQQWRNRARQHI